MTKTFTRMLVASMLIAWVLTLSTSHPVAAQETKATEAKKEDKAAEGDEDAEVAAARRRYGPNKAGVKIGEEEIFILGGRPEVEKDSGYAKIDSLKNGELVVMTLGQAIKFSTPFDLKFGTLSIQKENVAPNYPGVYSVWLKKTSSGWNIVFNDKPDIWSTMHKAKHDVGETVAQYKSLNEPIESLKFDMKATDGKGSFSITWGKHQWSAPFTIEP